MKIKFKTFLFTTTAVLLLIICAKGFSNEDDWICVGGKWIKHGNPSAPMPDKLCGN